MTALDERGRQRKGHPPSRLGVEIYAPAHG